MRKILSLLVTGVLVTTASFVFSVSQGVAAEAAGCMTPGECCDDPPYAGCTLASYSCSSDGTTCNETCTWHCPGS